MDYKTAPRTLLALANADAGGEADVMITERRRVPRRRRFMAHFDEARDLAVLATIVVMVTAGVVSGVFILSGAVATGPSLIPTVGAAAPSRQNDDDENYDRDRQALQREYDKTVPTLVSGLARVESKMDRQQEQLIAIQIAQRDLEALKTYTIGIATALGALIVGVVAQITQSWMNGKMLRKPAEQQKETSRG